MNGDYPPYIAIVGGSVQLPCNVTPPSDEDSVVLILWYRDDTSNPIYSIDARITSLSKAKHFPSDILADRGTFNITYPLSYLRINPVREDDGGEYRCRVDFKKARTVNRIFKLNVIVPVVQIVVFDDYGNNIKDIAGPYNEGSSVNLTCEAEGGSPSPSVHWFQGSAVIDDTFFISPKGTTVNTLSLSPLKRDDLMMVLSCKASNNNITAPVSHTIAIDMNLKPREVRIITPMNKLSSGVQIEFVCQSTGSKPPANIKWYIGKNELDNLGESVSEDGSVTTSFLSFVPSIEDNGKRLSCIAINSKYPDARVEDGFIVQIKCE
ncbi:cell adhesion molecule 4-like protein [Dinothrombium tinctorium]|uniref:Cell adhesion molecule 4-like protein n=1 Tax=Dinothrombium tinctorium TaxID=1965070 RepID=A0A3S4R8K3_9ACAR|nr:cell adhesion molecule 4-like protein [Dinothrombium tinctorium]RWS13016.1 cell adhesion molecule 4-like protein [Dinothrombium tinctorium]RWS16219.1 cell adhesion molecule 4-like protein [Dinothrombium tinctorium]